LMHPGICALRQQLEPAVGVFRSLTHPDFELARRLAQLTIDLLKPTECFVAFGGRRDELRSDPLDLPDVMFLYVRDIASRLFDSVTQGRLAFSAGPGELFAFFTQCSDDGRETGRFIMCGSESGLELGDPLPAHFRGCLCVVAGRAVSGDLIGQPRLLGPRFGELTFEKADALARLALRFEHGELVPFRELLEAVAFRPVFFGEPRCIAVPLGQFGEEPFLVFATFFDQRLQLRMLAPGRIETGRRFGQLKTRRAFIVQGGFQVPPFFNETSKLVFALFEKCADALVLRSALLQLDCCVLLLSEHARELRFGLGQFLSGCALDFEKGFRLPLFVERAITISALLRDERGQALDFLLTRSQRIGQPMPFLLVLCETLGELLPFSIARCEFICDLLPFSIARCQFICELLPVPIVRCQPVGELLFFSRRSLEIGLNFGNPVLRAFFLLDRRLEAAKGRSVARRNEDRFEAVRMIGQDDALHEETAEVLANRIELELE
jgi:hypothetical protein